MGFNPAIDAFNKIANGQMEIELYYADQLVPTAELFRAMQSGTIDCVQSDDDSMASPTEVTVFGGYFPMALRYSLDVPALFNKYNLINPSLTKYYQGVIDGHSPHGAITGAGALATAPQVAPDPNRRALLRSEWIAEFFQTTSSPKGHGFHLVTSNPHFHLVPEHDRAGFACYSFIPKAHVPL